MKAEGTRLVRDGWHALLAAVASVLLASCSTSDTEPFGFAVPVTQSSAQSNDFARATVNSAGQETAAQPAEFVMDENDPLLPEGVASAPTARPGSEGEALALQQVETPNPAEAAMAATVAENAPAPAPERPQQAAAAPDAPPTPQPTQFLESAPVQQIATAAPPPKSRGFLSALFGSNPSSSAVQQRASTPLIPPAQHGQAAGQQKPVVQLASTAPAAPLVAAAGGASAAALPGVREKNSLFEISRRSGLDDDADIDLYEDEDVQVASAAGLARLAPNGLLRQTERVDVACLKPSLVRVLKTVERHFGGKMVVTSGYRSPGNNKKARGARNSLHMYCAAADVQVEGVSKWQLAEFVRTMPGRGGVGTYCHTESVHIDVGPERDWNWRCRRRK